MPAVKRPGCCTHCGKEVYKVVTRYPEGPLHRFPRQLGKPLPEARRIDYVLVGGQHAALTSCKDCVPFLCDPKEYPKIWQQVIQSFLFEERDDVRAAMPSAPRTPEQRSANLRGILALVNNPPLGVIAISAPNA